MALNIWTKTSGFSLGTYSERVAVDILLPVDPEVTGVTYAVIAGNLPPGLRINQDRIVGTPFDVPRLTDFSVVIRATKGNERADRTFLMTIEGADSPEFVTTEGYLDVGPGKQFYTLDSTFIDYQLEAFDADIATGQKLSYFIADGDGRLPPGLTLTVEGRLVGFVQPTVSIKPEDGDGSFDNSFYDTVAYDFAYRPTNGFDSYVYDTVFYDYSLPSVRPKKLNQNYEFIVTVTDGDSVAKRKFGIYVVGDDYFRADNTTWLNDTGLFTADVTWLKNPIWKTNSDLGIVRANNYVTLILDTYDTDSIVYDFVDATLAWQQNHYYAVNDLILVDPDTQQSLICIEAHNSGTSFDVSKWADYGLPPGMSFDQVGGEVYGGIPYQPAISKVYRFIIDAIRYSGETDVKEYIATPANEGLNQTELRINTVEFPNVAEALNNVSSIILTTTDINLSEQTFEFGTEVTLTGFVDKYTSAILEGSSISGTTLTAGTVTGTIVPGMVINGDGIIPGTYIVANLSGSGNGSTWTISQSQTVELTNITTSTVVTLSFEATDAPDVGNYYKVEGNTNLFYNGYMLCTGSTTTSITLSYAANPGTYSTETATTIKKLIPSGGAGIEIQSSVIDPTDISSVDYSNPDEVVIYLNTAINFLTTNSTVIDIRYIVPSTEIASTKRLFYVNVIGEVDSVITWVSPSDLGTLNANFVSTIKLEATSTITNAEMIYTVTSGNLPSGLTLALDGELVGKVRQYGDNILYRSTWKANRSYNPNDVVIHEGQYYKALAPISGSSSFNSVQWISYSFTGTEGLTLLDGADFVFDGGLTKFDNFFTFTVKARDQYGYSASEKTFTIKVETPNQLVFSNIRTKPFLKDNQRSAWKDFINNTNIFTPTSIYRPNDPSFGLQTELSMLVYAGIETTEAARYVSAMGTNHKRKRFHFGEVKKAIAYIPGTYTPVYEVVYVQMIDPLEPNGKRLPHKIRTSAQPDPITVDVSNSIWASGYSGTDLEQQAKLERNALDAYRPDFNITIDSDVYKASNSNINEYYPNSISNWRDNIQNWTDGTNTLSNERNYLPLWMRSIQPGSKQELDFQLAVPLCYCKLGAADDIILNIKFSGFDFKDLDYTADRYIIDSVEGQTSDKYLVFRNDRITV